MDESITGLSDAEAQLIGDGTCPDCSCTQFWLGPRGGASRNVECVMCGSRFNVTPWYNGAVLFPHRIPKTEPREGPYWGDEPTELTSARARP